VIRKGGVALRCCENASKLAELNGDISRCRKKSTNRSGLAVSKTLLPYNQQHCSNPLPG
jgi:hypothetical protein